MFFFEPSFILLSASAPAEIAPAFLT